MEKFLDKVLNDIKEGKNFEDTSLKPQDKSMYKYLKTWYENS
jgi:hypothetical protein